MPLTAFHPAVARWFAARFGEATEPQARAWPLIAAGKHTLIAAPTGSGKTLAAFLASIDELVRRSLEEGGLADATQVVYVSPLKALSNDIEKNLEEPLAGIGRELALGGWPAVEIRRQVRTGDTPAAARIAMVKRPPHILVTTPESLYILLTTEGGRRMLATTRAVVVDEIHAVADDKRGSHLALTLERLDDLVRRQGGRLQRIGLSATQKPIEEVARFLVGAGAVPSEGNPACEIVDAGHGRPRDLAIEVPPSSPLEAVLASEVWEEIYDRLAELVRQHRTTLIFTNTRRLAERVTRHLAERLGADRVTAHHGSLARGHRLDAERRLKEGSLVALVATASLELGIDIGSVDLVCQLGSVPAISTFLQRVGRSRHQKDGVPKGRLFPLTIDELVEGAALLDAVRRGELDRLILPDRPLDILAQQIVASVAVEEWREDELYALMRRAWPYRALERKQFDDVVDMLATGFSTRRGRRAAYLHQDGVNGVLRARKGARLTAVTSGGAIPDLADYQVVLQPSGATVGTVHEDFAVESMVGDIFQLGNSSWRTLKVESGRILVEDARGAPPNIPFWLGEAPGRSDELSRAVSQLRQEAAERLRAGGREGARAWLEGDLALPASAAAQLADYFAAVAASLGLLPTQETLAAERFFDEAGDMHLVIHAPFGSRLNKAWGLALRKRFCQTFNFELQAAATEDSIVLSLGPTHSFPLDDAFHFLHSNTVRDVLTQAVLDAPLFGARWRWNAGRALAVPRFRGGGKVPSPLLRQQAEDLIAVVFPDQLACLENIVGEREVPEHPLVEQTLRDCLEEAMDIEGLERLLGRMERGEVTWVARDVVEPSPLAHAVLNANPYAFLDGAPLEERRTQAVALRRWLDPETASDLGALDAEAIARVRREAWPAAESADELHDALLTLGYVTPDDVAALDEGAAAVWGGLFESLVAQGRATRFQPAEGLVLWVVAERLAGLRLVAPGGVEEPGLALPERLGARAGSAAAELVELVRGRLEGVGPVTAVELARPLGLTPLRIEGALAALEGEGFVFRGRFTPGRRGAGLVDPAVEEWCDRRLLARIHRYTLDRLRREVDPVSQADFVRFLLAWQRVDPQERVEGPEGLVAIVQQMEGFEAAAAAWEGEILPARMKEYDPAWLDALSLSGRTIWGRATAAVASGGRKSGPVRATPIALLSRRELPHWREVAPLATPPAEELSGDAREVFEYLRQRGASFFAEIAEGTGLLHTQVEPALGELVAWGAVTADSFTGLRALLVPAHKRPSVDRSGSGRRAISLFGMENAGRWSLLPASEAAEAPPSREAIEAVAWTLLRRYGVVFRKLLERETLLPAWRELLIAYRRLEARGEIRGGRFVDGFSGEQFALPDAIGRLRSIRKGPARGTLVSVSAADPLNLLGVALAGERLPALAGNRLLYRDGLPIAVLEGREVRFLIDLDPAARWQAQSALQRRSVAPKLKAYLGRSA
jgi:ATP-dependent Lhr-like helicase